MDNIFEIKDEFKSTVVAFNGSGLPLGSRSDLHILAAMAKYNPSFKKFFVNLPTEEQIKEYKADQFIRAKEEPVKITLDAVPEQIPDPAVNNEGNNPGE